MQSSFRLLCLCLLLSVFTCEKEVITIVEPAPTAPTPTPAPTTPTDTSTTYIGVGGYVQKGPYLNGTTIDLTELDSTLLPTGSTFSTQIVDNSGTFTFREFALASPYVELKANGFYYNEVTDAGSSAQLTLYALSDLNGTERLNVNILSHLERRRVLYLVERGATLTDAKQQAQTEILAVFEMNADEDMANSELLDISQPGEANGMLLALSVIAQGYLSVAEFSELLANISSDMLEDGKLDNPTLGSTLINNAKSLRAGQIRSNLEQRYGDLGLTAEVPDFETHLLHFIENTNFEFSNQIEYSAVGKYGPNLLDSTLVELSRGEYSMQALIPVSSSVRIEFSGPNWLLSSKGDHNWTISDYDIAHASRTFTATGQQESDLHIYLQGSNPWAGAPRDEDYHHPEPDSSGYEPFRIYPTDTTRIILYENGSVTPTWTKSFVLE